MSDSKQPRVTQNQMLLLLIALTLIRGLIYISVTIPWWQGHDEDYHFAQIKLLIDQMSPQGQNWPQEMAATFVAFPVSRWTMLPEDVTNLVNISDRYTDFGRSSLSYYPYTWLGIFLTHQDLLFQLFALRIVSVLTTCGTIIFAFLSAKHIFADSLMTQILIPWLILFNPSFMVTGSTISDANLAILLSTIVFYLLLLEITKERIGWRTLLALGLTLLAFQTKPTTYFLILVWGLLILVYAWKLDRKYWLWGVIVGGLFIVSLPFFSPRTVNTLKYYLQLKVSSEGLSYVFSSTYFWYTFSFFWILLGWSVHRLAEIWYVILLFFVLSTVIGLLIYGVRYLKKKGAVLGIEQKGLLLSLLFVAVSIAGLLGLGILRYGELEGRSARYIFPVVVPLSILMIGGWRTLLPTNWRDIGLTLLLVAFFLFDTMVWLDYAIPWYYPFWP